MTQPWMLVLEESDGDPARRVGGLPIALRLALDAQHGGCAALVLAGDSQRLQETLRDTRLTLPVVECAPPEQPSIRVSADTVLHRDTFKILMGDDPPATLEEASSVPPYGFAPIRVVDAESARRAERLLFRALRKAQDGWTSRWLNRPISLFLSRWLVKTPLTPNQVSIGILAIGLTGAWFASRGTYGHLLAGAALFHLQSVLDGCDGEMSRVTYRGSLKGQWLDTIGDDLTNYAFFAGAGFGLYGETGNVLFGWAAVVTVACGTLASAIEYRYLIRIGSGDLLRYPISAGSPKGGWSSRVTPLFKRDTFVFLTLLAALAGAVGPMLVGFSLGAAGILIGVLRAEIRMRRERTA